MKKIIILFGVLILSTQILWATITVDGFAYLENQTNHSGIEIFLERTIPSSLTYTFYTSASGYYTAEIETGIYDITYSNDSYSPESLNNQTLYANTTLPDMTLIVHQTLLNVPSDFATIQSAIDYEYTANGDTVLVAPGTYYENINFSGKNIIVASLFLTTQDTSYISQTIIDGNQNGSVITFNNGEALIAVLSGFTIQNGSATSGGGIRCRNNSSPSIENVTIIGNDASSGGGIICYYSSSPSLLKVKISGNSATGTEFESGGGGMLCYLSSPSLESVTISGNSASNNGGGIYCNDNSSPSLENVTISGNSASDNGGGMFCYLSSPSLLNTIVTNNTGNHGICVYAGNPTIIYSDFYDNENGNFYGCGQWVGVNVTTNANGDSCDAYYNIQENPLFVDPLNGDYHLSWVNYPIPDSTKSPCIDAGDPSSPLDPDGTIADMGAFYFNQNVSIDEPAQTSEFNLTNYPNPISSNINNLSVSFSIHKPGKVKIQLYNVRGQLISNLINEDKNVGEYTITYPVNKLSSGIYFTRMSVDGVDKEIRKVVLLR